MTRGPHFETQAALRWLRALRTNNDRTWFHANRAVWDEIRVHHDELSILLAGHEPLFSSLTAHLLASPRMRVDFKKGAIVCIEVDRFGAEPQGALRWMLTPKLA